MKKNQFLCLLLAAVMLLSAMSFSASAEVAAVQPADSSDIESQLSLISSHRSSMMQNDSQNTWYYSVMDLDHDGNLEFVAATLHPQDRSTNLKIWEVNADRTWFTECNLDKDPDESFPDIMTDSADTFHDTETDTWYYMFYDNIILSDTEVYTIKTAVNMKDGIVHYDAYAVEHTFYGGGMRNVTYTDSEGFTISPDQYNAAGTNAFMGKARSNTAFEWLTAADAETDSRLNDSYMVFMGIKTPTQSFPVPKPAALETPAGTPTPVPSAAPTAKPVPTATPAPKPTYLTITKNPTNENKKAGGTALFVACSNVFDSLTWTMVSPQGGQFSVESFAYAYPGASITGQYSTTLSIANVSADMNGWGAYCTFYYNGQVASTSTAYLYVTGTPVDDGGTMYGTVANWNYSTVTVSFDARTQVDIPWTVCVLDGDIYIGAPVTAIWAGTTTKGLNFIWCSIEGSHPQPQPVYGSMSGLAYHDTAFTEYIVLQNGSSFHVNGYLCNILYGDYIDGCSCTVYYTDYPSESTIYQVDIYGVNVVYEPDPIFVPDPDPIYTPEWPESDPLYDPIGDEHNRVTCPLCGNHFSVGLNECPVCGWTP